MRKPLQPFELEGKYIRLVPLRLEHSGGLVKAASHSRKTFHLTTVPANMDSARAYVEQSLKLWEQGEVLAFAILEKSSGEVVGTSRYLKIEYWPCPEGDLLYRSPGIPHAVEIGGTWIGEPWQRTGINTDAKIALLTQAFEKWQVLRVTLKTDARNVQSRNNIERVGAKFEGILRAHMPATDGGARDSAFYSIVQNEWPGVKINLQARLR